MSFACGSVLPLAISTSAMGLYPTARLGLPLPQATRPEPLNKIILVWGGASSCGSAAVQLAVASGATVVSTASARNHEFVKSIGATAVLDYNNANAVDEMVSLIKETPGQFAGALDAIGSNETWRACAEIAKCLGGGRVATTLPGQVIHAADGVEIIGINDTASLPENTAVVEAVWGKFIPEGLKNGSLRPAPEPVVVGKGLEKIADAIALGLKGVSAAKLVVEL
ncbi:Alcohol dehydrogenase GroES-like domain protein [Aspergillus sclerotialis]|uniref:Alcohol dehydrogenase GroES-like domain protein n=1 Tax=Aspergillus sclerotialis TaxID=2070753 RepID=A0A3A3AC75_9EURO|nr:Alcohol dehydrogenase GroES-like domain protein [Aspergillus sclerotialis]